jgi:excinuclease ABC subunit C
MSKSQEKIRSLTKKLPGTPGVYKFIGSKKEVLYVGKATSLKSRVNSYFGPKLGEKRSPLIEKMVGEAKDIKFEKTDSVLEAIILESKLIKSLKPKYNTADKDQKSFNYVVITDEEFPRVLVMRERELTLPPSPLPPALTQRGWLPKREGTTPSILNKFGPFTSGSQLKEALKIIRKIFPFRDKCTPGAEGGLPCFNYQLGLCPGVCIGAISKQEYAKTIKHIKTFFEGNKKKLIRDLEKEMKALAQKREFEKATEIKKKVFALKHIQDVAFIIEESGILNLESSFKIEAYDVAHISGSNMVGVMVNIENGEPNKAKYRMFKIRGQKNADDTKALGEILERRFKHPEWTFPNLIVVDGGVAQLNITENTLKNLQVSLGSTKQVERLKDIKIVAVTKDEKHRPKQILNIEKFKDLKLKIKELEKQILLANSEAHRFALSFHRKLRDNINKSRIFG